VWTGFFFSKEAAQCVVAFTSHIVLGPFALMVLAGYHAGPPWWGISAFAHGSPDPRALQLDIYTCICGEILIGNLLYQVLFWFLGWEETIDSLLHHLGFLAAGILVASGGMCGKVAVAAIGMEVSSPFLSLHILLEGFCSGV